MWSGGSGRGRRRVQGDDGAVVEADAFAEGGCGRFGAESWLEETDKD